MKDNNPADNLAWRVIWRQLISSVGSQAGMLRRSMIALLLAALMQGIAFACLYPIVDALLRGEASPLLTWALALSAAAFAALALRWYGLGFEYRGHLAQATMNCACAWANSYAACRWKDSSAAERAKRTPCCWAAWMKISTM